MEFSEAVNDQDVEAALALFAGDARVLGDENITYEGKDEIEDWLLLGFQNYESFYKFSEFDVEGDDVTWTWFASDPTGKWLCVGNATMQDGQISFLDYYDCQKSN